MNPIKLIRKLGKALRGGSKFREIFLAVLLGFAVGMIPGVNLTLLLCIILLLLLNTNGGLAVLAFAIGKICCLALAAATFQIGYFLMHTVGLVALVRALADTPVLALLDLHVYSLLGALPIIVLVGGGMAWAVGVLIAKAQVGIISTGEQSEKFRKVAENKFVRFLLWLAFGRRKGTLAEVMAQPSPLFARNRLIAGAVVVVIIVIFQVLFVDVLARKGIQSAISLASGAEVNVADVDLSLLAGRLVVEGLEVTDPARPTHNQVQADRIVMDLSVGDLLARRCVVDMLESDSMRTDVERRTPGKVYREPEEEEAPPPPVDLGKLGQYKAYLDHAKRLHEKVQKLREYLKGNEPDTEAEQPDKERLAEEARRRGYLRLSAKDYLARHPTWVIRDLVIRNVKVTDELPGLTIEGKNLSSHPSLLPEKAELKAKVDEDALESLKKGLLEKVLGGKEKPSLKGLFGK